MKNKIKFFTAFCAVTAKTRLEIFLLAVALLMNANTSKAQALEIVKDLPAESFAVYNEFNHPIVPGGEGTVYFFLSTTATGMELWKSDGTTGGTIMVKDINPGTPGSDPYPQSMIYANGKLYFNANNGTDGNELWVSDGTLDGTQMLKDINPGPGNSNPYYLINIGGTIFFDANNGTDGGELWKTDGTTDGTQIVKNINPTGNSYPDFFHNVNGTLFFSADDGVHGEELWKSDGTLAGTQMVKDINPNAPKSISGLFEVYNGALYFSATNGTNGYELWRSDGTLNGTQMLIDIRVGPGNGVYDSYLGVSNNTLFFVANDGTVGYELWKTDGTLVGTQLVKDVCQTSAPGTGGLLGFGQAFTEMNGQLYFKADNCIDGMELWKTDGTLPGTTMVTDINPVGFSMSIGSNDKIIGLNGRVYFKADDGVNGFELWKTDGTTTAKVLNTPNPSGMVDANEILFFFLNTPSGFKLAKIQTRLPQAINNFGTIAPKAFGDATFTLAATATSGLAVTYTSSNLSVATISGNTVTIVGAGTTTITANQSGDPAYKAASSVAQDLVVNKRNQTITFAGISGNYGAAAFELGATITSNLTINYASSNTNVATVSGSIITIVGLGTTIITASQAGNSNYNSASDVTQTLTVNKGSQTITFSALAPKTFGESAYTLGATSSSSLAVTYASSNTSVATISGATVTIVGAGTTIITASQAGNSNYNSATDVTQTLTVNKGSQTITFSALAPKTFGESAYTLGATSSSNLAVTYASSNTSVATISGATVTIVGAGTTIITASQAGNSNYNAANDVTQTLTVIKANQAINFNALPVKNQGDVAFALTATSSFGLSLTYSVVSGPATISGSTLTMTGAGTVVVKAGQAGNGNYNAATDVTQSFCVNPAKPAITLSLANAETPILTSSSTEGNQWYLNGTAIVSATNATYNASQIGSYTVKTTIGGCASELSTAQALVVTGLELKEIGETSVVCYPNPAQGEVVIKYSRPEQVQQVEIIDSRGKVMQTGGNELINTSLLIEGYRPGLYLVRIKAGNQLLTSKFLKK
jgi:ELWxxDGT repeat protein